MRAHVQRLAETVACRQIEHATAGIAGVLVWRAVRRKTTNGAGKE